MAESGATLDQWRAFQRTDLKGYSVLRSTAPCYCIIDAYRVSVIACQARHALWTFAIPSERSPMKSRNFILNCPDVKESLSPTILCGNGESSMAV